MAFYRRRRMMKKRGRSSRLRRFSRKPTVRKLAKRVAGISRSLRKATEWQDWTHQTTLNNVAPYTQYHVNHYRDWEPTFLMYANATDPTLPWQGQAGWQGIDWISTRLQMEFQMNTDFSNVTYTVFLVQLKDQFRNSQFNDDTGVLTLSERVHYTNANGMVSLNKRYFVVRGIRRFQMGNFGANPSTTGDAGGNVIDYKRVSFRLRPNKKILRQGATRNLIGHNASTPQSTDALDDPDPSKNFYVLIFNDDATAETRQTTTIVANHVCKTY